MDAPPAARFQGDAVASTRRPARCLAWNCAVRPEAINRFLGFRPAAQPASATSRSLCYLYLGPESNVVAGSGASGNAISGHFEPLSRCNLRALLPLSWPPADPHAGARHHHNLGPTSRAAPPPPRHPEGLTQPQTQEALLPHPPPRQAPAPSPRAKRGAAPWRRPAAASSRPRSPT